MATKSEVFEMNDVHVTRGGRKILKGITWRVERGEHWALLGGNGSGKTSLLRVLMGYLTATSGKVHVQGRSSAVNQPEIEWDAWRKKIGFVSSSIAEMIEPVETAREVVMAGKHAMVNYWQRDPSTEKEDREAAKKILKKVHCDHLADHPWAYLSQGERQRLLIGRALMAEKLDVLILDEPCAGLDPVARENFLHFIQGLTGKGTFKSLIMVTHHVEEIIPNISHALVLHDGESVACGKKEMALNSASVSRAFGGDLALRSRLGRYRLYFEGEEPLPGKVVV